MTEDAARRQIRIAGIVWAFLDEFPQSIPDLADACIDALDASTPEHQNAVREAVADRLLNWMRLGLAAETPDGWIKT